MLWVYDYYDSFISFCAATGFIRQNLTSNDGPRAERVNSFHLILLHVDLPAIMTLNRFYTV